MSIQDCTGISTNNELNRNSTNPTTPERPTDDKTRKASTREAKIFGLLLNVAAAIGLAVSGAIIQFSELGGYTASFGVGYLGTLSGLVGFLGCSRKKYPRGVVIKVFLNGFFCAGLFNSLYFLSLDFITVGDATAVNYFSAFGFCLLLEIACFKFIPHWCTIFSTLIGLAGLVCISQSQAGIDWTIDLDYILGVLLSIISGFFGALFYINMHKLTSIPVCLLVAAYYSGCCVFPLPWMIADGMEIQTSSIGLRFLAILGYSCYICVGYFGILGSRKSLPSLSFLVKLLSIVLCYILQIFWLREDAMMLSIVGSCLICVSIMLQSIIAVMTSPPAQVKNKNIQEIL